MNKKKCTDICYVDCPLYMRVEYIHNAESLWQLTILCTTLDDMAQDIVDISNNIQDLSLK